MNDYSEPATFPSIKEKKAFENWYVWVYRRQKVITLGNKILIIQKNALSTLSLSLLNVKYIKGNAYAY